MANKKNLFHGVKTIPLTSALSNRELLQTAIHQLRTNTAMPGDLREWLTESLASIANGDSANKAFGLSKKGRPPKYSEEMQLLIGSFVALSPLGKHKSCGKTVGAFTQVAEEFHVSESQCETYYALYKAHTANEDHVRTVLLADEHNQE